MRRSVKYLLHIVHFRCGNTLCCCSVASLPLSGANKSLLHVVHLDGAGGGIVVAFVVVVVLTTATVYIVRTPLIYIVE